MLLPKFVKFDGGGALINQGIHTVDLLLYLLGDVTRVQAVNITALHDIDAEDTSVATLEFANGAVGGKLTGAEFTRVRNILAGTADVSGTLKPSATPSPSISAAPPAKNYRP